MEETSTQQKRMSAIPRLSKLPRPASGIPKPVPTSINTSRPPSTATLRSQPSRESLGGELRNPRLRPSLSHNQLRNSICGAGDLQSPKLRSTASREQLSRRTSLASRPPSQLHSPRPSLARAPSTPDRNTTHIIEEHSTTPPYDPPGEALAQESDGYIFKRRVTLTRRPSESFARSPFQEAAPLYDIVDLPHPTSSSPEDNGSFDFKPRSSKARPSLSERTMETLAQLPSSPAMGKKMSSSFFDNGRPSSRTSSRPRSRADSASSRPGSSYTSDGSVRMSLAGSRPGSSSGPQDMGFSSFRTSTISYKPPLTTIKGTPQRRTSGMYGSTTPTGRPPSSRNNLAASTTKLPPLDDGRSMSPVKYSMGPPRAGSKTVANRSSKAKGSTNGLFKKPSLPAINRSAAQDEPGSRSSGWDGSIAPLPKPSKKASNNLSAPTLSDPPQRKTSAALREQIAQARAARKAELQQSTQGPPDQETPIIPADDGFDFGVSHDDPFGQRKGESPKKKVLLQRINAARTSGRLNIAALDLKEIPMEVMKMYDTETMGTYDGSWAESVDLTRFVAADNELENLDDFIFPDTKPESYDDEEQSRGNIFGGLETLDLHGNLLVGVPLGLRRLNFMTSLNLSSNRLTNNSLDTIAQIGSLRDLKLANNLFYGPLNSNLANLTDLEILDLHGNNISALPRDVDTMTHLRILNLSENSFESLPFDALAMLPLTELNVRKNKLSGTLIDEDIESLPQLQNLDASANKLTRLVPLGSGIKLPNVHSLSLSMNKLQGLPDMTSWTSLLTLTVDENAISSIPNSFFGLEKLRHADFSSNDIRVVPPEVSRMENLTMIRLSGNPLRDKKFLSITTDELKEVLALRLEPPPPYQEPVAQIGIMEVLADAKATEKKGRPPLSTADSTGEIRPVEDDGRSDDDFATPPQSPSRSRSQTVSSLRSRSHTLTNQTWPVKTGGILDRSRTESSSLHPVVCSKVAADHKIREVHIHHNLFATFPNSLSFFAETLTTMSLAHNRLVGETYLAEDLELPALKELNLASNHITGLGALTKFMHAPKLEKLDVSMNRLNALTLDLKEAFPDLNVLLVANNHIVDLEPEMIKGLKIVDVSSNDIAHLNPRIGLLGGPEGLKNFDVMGNRFRIPRYNVLERGTDATLRWLRGRVPVAEMAAWKEENGDAEID